jgi:hypothetical protein
MGFHTFDPAETERLEDPTRFRFCSREELLGALPGSGRLPAEARDMLAAAGFDPETAVERSETLFVRALA